MTDGAFRWELIDHRLVGLKLTNLAEEMHESIRAEIGQIQLDNVGNSNSQTVSSQMIAMHLRRADEWIEKIYSAYCEVWEKQGHQKTAAFIRAVSSHAIPTIISARTNAVVADLSTRRARTGSQIEPHNARMESFKQSMSRLAARWARKLEIEAKECGHAESAARRNAQREHDVRETNQAVHEAPKSEMTTTGRSAMAAAKLPAAHVANDSPNWARLNEGFGDLATEERTVSPRVPGLIASVLPDRDPDADVAKWATHQTPSASLKGRFDLLATHAGAALGAVPRGAMPIDYWLHRLRQFLSDRQNKWLHEFISTNDLTATVGEHPIIDFVCEASALFCTHLEKEAIERTYAQEKELEARHHEWITSNFVSVSAPSGSTHRSWVGLVARTAHIPIPIEFLSCQLDGAPAPRGHTVCSSPSLFLNNIANTHSLKWWITERGLWMARQPPSGVSCVDRYGSLTDLKKTERPLDPVEIKQAGVESKTPNAETGPRQQPPPAADARKVAIGVAQVSLADLNVPVGTSLKHAKRALLKLGAPARKLKDPRILEAADYKIKNPKCSYQKVSIKFFETPGRADSIRSWVNKRKSSDSGE
jgi:hypothetical protein